MIDTGLIPLSQLLEQSFFQHFIQNETIEFGSEVIKVNSNYKKNAEGFSNYFLFSKHTTVEENLLYCAKSLYDLLSESPKHIDELLLKYAEKNQITINVNIERIIYLSLTFLFSIDKIKLEGNTIIKQKDDESVEF